MKSAAIAILLVGATAAAVPALAQDLQISPAAVNFGNQPQGSKGNPWTLTVNNTTSKSIALGAISVSDNSNFFEANNCPLTLSPYANCNIQVGFSPSKTGAITGQLLVPNASASSPQGVVLSGNGTASSGSGTPNPALSPSSIAFGSQTVHTSSSTWNVDLSNNGTGTLNITSISTSDPADFTAATDCTGTLSGNSTCHITVAFAPGTVGPISANLVVVDNAGTQSIPLNGTGLAAAASVVVAPTAISFSPQAVGTSSSATTLTVSNTSASAITLSAFNGLINSAFSETDNCNGYLAAHATCNVNLIFTPTAVGSTSTQLTFSANGTTQSVPLQGSGLSSQASVLFSPSSVDFSTLAAGTTSAPWTITVSNTGNVAATFTQAPTVAGSTAFTLKSTCGSTLAPHTTCDMTVLFAPSAPGQYTAQITSLLLGANAPQVVTLTGNASSATPSVQFYPGTIDFGSLQWGTIGNSWTVTLVNSTAVPVTFANPLTLAGANAFTFTTTCGATIAAYSQCQLKVAFAPLAPGIFQGQIVANINGGATQTLTLNGTGIGAAPAITLTPAVVDFGSVLIGSTSKATTFTVTNTSVTDATFSAPIHLTGSASYAIASSTCGSTLAAGASCTVQIAFAPAAEGSVTGQLTVLVNGILAAHTAALNGAGVNPAPTLAFSPATFAFGDVATWSTHTTTVKLTNTGKTPAQLNQDVVMTSSNPNLAIFSDLNWCTNTPTLAPGQSCNVDVTVDLYATGTFSAQLSITPAGGSATTMTFTANGVTPTLTLTPSTLAFGTQNLGTSATLPVTVANTSTVPATLQVGAPGNTDYTAVAGTCGATLAARSSCVLNYAYKPSASGASSTTVPVTLVESTAKYALTLTGTGNAALPTLSITPTGTVYFPATTYGTTSAAQAFTVTNTSTVQAGLSISFYQPNSSAFRFSGNTCGNNLAAGASCTVSVTYTPNSVNDTALLNITETVSSVRTTINLAGSGVGRSTFTITPSQLDFGLFPAGQPFVDGVIEITNTCSAGPCVPSSFNLQLNDPNFAVDPTQCPALLNPGQTCAIVILFSPVQVGNIKTTLSITDSNGGVGTVVLTGIGPATPKTVPTLTVSTSAMIFPTTPLYTYSSVQTMTLTNPTKTGVQYTTFTNFYNFPTGGGTCANGSGYLQAGASCTIQIAFFPQATGTIQGFLRVSTGDGAPPAAVLLEGTGGSATGAAANYTVTVNPTELNLASGQNGTASFTLTPTGGYKGTITLACAGLPVGVTCTFVPPTLTADGSNKVLTSILTVSTTGINSHAGSSLAALGLFPAVLLLTLLAFRKRFRVALLPLALLLLATAATTLSTGCGTGLGANVTPVGAHQVTVVTTATANGATTTQTATFTLNITK